MNDWLKTVTPEMEAEWRRSRLQCLRCKDRIGILVDVEPPAEMYPEPR